jgi:hypothetical protein
MLVQAIKVAVQYIDIDTVYGPFLRFKEIKSNSLHNKMAYSCNQIYVPLKNK